MENASDNFKMNIYILLCNKTQSPKVVNELITIIFN